MKLRGWLLLLLFAHVMLHPWVHAIGNVPARDLVSISGSSNSPDHGLNSIDQCELCRIGHNANIAPALPRSERLNPRWIHVALQAVNYASLQADLRRPSRAPPTR